MDRRLLLSACVALACGLTAFGQGETGSDVAVEESPYRRDEDGPLPPSVEARLRGEADPATGKPLFSFVWTGEILKGERALTRGEVAGLRAAFELERAELDRLLERLAAQGILKPEEVERYRKDLESGGLSLEEARLRAEAAERETLERTRRPLPASSVPKPAAAGSVEAILEDIRGRTGTALPEGWRERVAEEWSKQLGEFESTKEAGAFLERSGAPISLATLDFPNAPLAMYTRGKLFVDEPKLTEAARQLRVQGVSEEDLPKVLAAKTLPIIGHEARHGLDEERLEAKVGLPFRAGTKEKELLAFYNTVETSVELQMKRPELWKYRIEPYDTEYEFHQQSWAEGPRGLEKMIDRGYTSPSILEQTDRALRTTYKKIGANLAEGAEAYQSLQRELARTRDPGARAALESALGAFPDPLWVRDVRASTREALEVVRDRERLAALRAALREEVERVRAAWESEEWNAWRLGRSAAAKAYGREEIP